MENTISKNGTKSIFKSIKIFITSWLLSEIILLGVILTFVDHLNKIGIINMGDSFSPGQVFWGYGIVANIIRVIIYSFFAGVFGLLYGHLVKRKCVSKEKIFVSLINSILSVFGEILIIFLILMALGHVSGSEIKDSFTSIFSMISGSTFYTIFLLLNLVGAFIASYLSIDLSIRGDDDYESGLELYEKPGTLLNIKWYHYFWLWIPIGLYGQLILDSGLKFILSIIGFIKHVKWFEFLGVRTSNEGWLWGGGSIGVLGGNLFLTNLIIYGSFSLLGYLIRVLSGTEEVKKNKKIIMVILVGIVIPFIVLFLLAWFDKVF
jgi:hypothetical protein